LFCFNFSFQTICYVNLKFSYLIEQVSIYWKKDQKWYPAVVARFSESSVNKWFIHYDDGDKEKHTFDREKWRVPVRGHSTRNQKVIETWKKKARVI
jgi:hypothetical protein